jgi:hypothetical protein
MVPELTTIRVGDTDVDISDGAFAICVEKFVVALARANCVPAPALQEIQAIVNLRHSARGDAPPQWQKLDR